MILIGLKRLKLCDSPSRNNVFVIISKKPDGMKNLMPKCLTESHFCVELKEHSHFS